MAQTLNPGDSIQGAINSSPGSGEVISLNAGTYNVANGSVGGTGTTQQPAIDINKHIKLIGQGATPADTVLDMSAVTGNTLGLGITADGASAADRIEVQNMTIVGDYYGIMVGNANGTQQYTLLKDLVIGDGGYPNLSIGYRDNTDPRDDTFVVRYLEMENIVINSQSTWAMMIWDTLQFLKMKNVEMNYTGSGLGFGMHFEVAAQIDFTSTEESYNWDIQDLTVEGFGKKGIYLENVDNAYFKNITVSNCGFDTGASWGGTGFELNLKRGDYQNILIENINLTDCGTANANSMAMAFRGRDKMTDPFASYGTNPGYVGNIGVLGGSIDGANIGLCLGEYYNGTPAYNMSPMRVDVRDFTIKNTTGDAIIDARGNRCGFLYNGKYVVE